jgi:hypothetical protein
MANGYRLVHDPADPRCMIEEAMGWEHDSHHDGQIQMTPDQEAIWNQAADLFDEIHDNHRQGRPARNETESRIYAELDLDAAQEESDLERALDEDYAEQADAYNRGGLQAVSPQWLATPDGRNFLDEIRQAPRAELEPDLEPGA